MCALSNHLEKSAERVFETYMGVLRVRHLTTDFLKNMYAAWDGEACLNGIPVGIIQSELLHRENYAHTDWTM
jgi:hypothetical protein